jgi:hypothetical protein
MPTYSWDSHCPTGEVTTIVSPPLDKHPFVWYIIPMRATKTSWNKFDKGTQVHHRDNHNWKGVVVRDLDRGMPVNGVVLVNHNGRVARMHKDLLRVSFYLDAKKEFGG